MEINGAFRWKKGSCILVLYSAPLCRFLIERNVKSVNFHYISESLCKIRQGITHKIFFERKGKTPIAVIFVGKSLPSTLKRELKETKKNKPVKVIIEGINENQLVKYNKSIKYVVPENLDYKINPSDAIFLSCHIRCTKGKHSLNYQLIMKNRIAEEIAVKKDKVAILREPSGTFVIRKWKEGRIFNLYKNQRGHPLVYMPIPPFLIRESEKKIFLRGRTTISSKIKISQQEFDLDISRFFLVKEERELALSLIARNVKIEIPMMHKREADIILPEFNSQIEITTIMPVKNKASSKNGAHGEGVHLNARICEGFLRVSKGIVKYFFVIFHKDWLKQKWVKELLKLTKPYVVCIPTDFGKRWHEDVAKDILSILRGGNANIR